MKNYNDEIKSLLNEVTDYLNANFYQSSENYNKIICTDKTNVFTLCNKRCIVSTWSCGAIVSINKQIFYISEDDGYWFVENLKDDKGYEFVGCKTGGTSLSHITSITRALNDLLKYYLSRC